MAHCINLLVIVLADYPQKKQFVTQQLPPLVGEQAHVCTCAYGSESLVLLQAHLLDIAFDLQLQMVQTKTGCLGYRCRLKQVNRRFLGH